MSVLVFLNGQLHRLAIANDELKERHFQQQFPLAARQQWPPRV